MPTSLLFLVCFVSSDLKYMLQIIMFSAWKYGHFLFFSKSSNFVKILFISSCVHFFTVSKSFRTLFGSLSLGFSDLFNSTIFIFSNIAL